MNDTLFHIVISDPPTKYVFHRQREKINDDGSVKKEKVEYLTANLFYGDQHWSVRYTVVNYAKDWIIPFLQKMPKIQKCKIEITYYYPTDGFDLDNKLYFWIKIILDVMKTPNSDEILKAQKYKNTVKSIDKIQDDSVRFVDEIKMKYQRGAPALELKIIGILKDEQGTLF